MNEKLNLQTKRYRASRYNFFFDAEDGTHLAFNAISCGFAKIEEKNRVVLHQFFKTFENGGVKPEWLDQELWSALLAGKFVVEEDSSELDLLKVVNRVSRFNSASFSLAIAPTLACNFNCIYCYAEKKDEFMDERVQSSIIRFVEKKSASIKTLHIGWIGGEPLLAIDVIENLSNAINEVCRNQGIELHCSLITNGYLLTPEIFQRLLKTNIDFIQVTLDGPQGVHDERRFHQNGDGTFKVITENIREIQCTEKHNIKIGIRINLDKTNAKSAVDLIEILDEMNLKRDIITIEPAPVGADTKACKSVAKCLLSPSFYYKKYYVSFIKKILQHGFKVYIQPEPVLNNCMAVALNTFVVDPKGLLYKCWNDCGLPHESVGYIDYSGQVRLNNKIIKWLLWEPFDIPGCRKCKILPLCLGGCPYRKMNSIRSCTGWKYNMKEMLNVIYACRFNQQKRKEVI